MMKYEVGQVLYVIMRKEKSVVPVRVVEQVSRKTLDGETVSYIVELPVKPIETISLEKLGTGIYASSEAAMQIMLKNADETIRKIIQKAEAIATSSFGLENNVRVPDDSDQTGTNESDTMEVDLGDGIKGKISVGALE